jgi:RNA polymerase sigma factor (sigma-70 family)
MNNYPDNREDIVVGVGRKQRLSKEEQATASRQELFESTQRYAMGVVGDVLAKIPSFSRDEKNLVMQEGLLGLWLATDKFDASKGASIATYAHMQIYYRAMHQVRVIFKEKNRTHELCSSDGEFRELTIREKSGKIDRELAEDSKYIKEIIELSYLSELEERVIAMYYGLGDNPPMIYQQIGDILGFSKQRAEQLIKKGMVKMKRAIKKEDSVL